MNAKEWTLEGHLAALVARWEAGMITADEVVREVRTTLGEEREIREAETKEVCPAIAALDHFGGEFVMIVGSDENDEVTGLHIACKGETAKAFAPVVKKFEATFEEDGRDHFQAGFGGDRVELLDEEDS